MIKKGKLFGIFNIIDFAIILVLVASVAGFFMTSGLLEKIGLSTNDQIITAQVRVEGVSSDYAAAFASEDALYFGENGVQVASILSVERSASYKTITKVDGSMVTAQVPRRYDILITLEGVGTKTELGHFLNGNQHIAPGGTIQLSTLYAQADAVVLSVESRPVA